VAPEGARGVAPSAWSSQQSLDPQQGAGGLEPEPTAGQEEHRRGSSFIRRSRADAISYTPGVLFVKIEAWQRR
jgi:hypothetical protein